jgi:hypothetical protein
VAVRGARSNGEKADLPVVQSEEVELTINFKTAKALHFSGAPTKSLNENLRRLPGRRSDWDLSSPLADF